MLRTAAWTVVLATAATVLWLTSCGGIAGSGAGEGGAMDGGHGGQADGAEPTRTDGGDARGGRDGEPSQTDARVDAKPMNTGGGPVDAGYYHGDGSFWVEGGAYPGLGTPDASTGEDGASDVAIVDASTGCSALAACCPSLSGPSRSLCELVASTGTAMDCASELTMLEAGGSCTGVTILASKVQVPPNRLVSDGTLLFWTTTETPGLLAMPVSGGAITTLLTGPIVNDFGVMGGASGYFLAVDAVDIYVLESNNLVRIPKDGSAATLVNESSGLVVNASILENTAYWVEGLPGGHYGQSLIAKSAPLAGVTISSFGGFKYLGNYPVPIGVTSDTVFLGGPDQHILYSFPLSTGIPAGGLAKRKHSCSLLSSDTDAVYCTPQMTGSNLRVAGDGTATVLGPAVTSSYVVYDDTYVYWADATTVGSIMKAPKAGGGSSTVLATDTSPTAIAVDATFVYWADAEGYIKRIPK